MQHADLGPLRVSRLALGTMLMGGKTPVPDAHAMLDAFTAAGGTLLDTADTYGDGVSEEVLAPWLARRRADVVVATKLRFGVSDPGGEGLEPDRIRRACDASLRRMGIDEIDLYQVHAPDPAVPLEDALEALDGLVRAGKVRALGASNFPAWLLAWALAIQEHEGWAPFVSLQPQYSLVERSIETEILPLCRWAGLGVLPWGPLGAGFLSGRYERGGEMPTGSRMADAGADLEEAPARRAVERNFAALDVVREVATETGATVPQVALAWLLHQPGVTAPVIGPRTPEHLDGLLGGSDLHLDDAQLERLGRPTAPPAAYPGRFLREQSGIDVEAQARRARAGAVR